MNDSVQKQVFCSEYACMMVADAILSITDTKEQPLNPVWRVQQLRFWGILCKGLSVGLDNFFRNAPF